MSNNNDSEVFLPDKEVEIMTGRSQKSKQIKKLREQGVHFYVTADGHPRVPRAPIEGKNNISNKINTPKTWESEFSV